MYNWKVFKSFTKGEWRLWIMASLEQISYLPMVICFIIFLVNDLYGFVNWRAMQRRQGEFEIEIE